MVNNRRGVSLVKVMGILFILVVLAWFWLKKPWLKLEEIVPKSITAEQVLAQINTYRTENKLMALKRNEKLDRAALSRLRVVTSESDFSGEKTGVTLVNAVKNNSYNYNLVGDLYLENVDGDSQLVELWLADTQTKKRLTDRQFRDAGIALERIGLAWRVMVVLGRQASVTVEKTGAGGYPQVSWGGPELWRAVNKRRVELGVNPLSQRDELCTIAAIRLNQLLDLGKLDGHAGFEPLFNREDLKWIREKYTLSEFLIAGYPTPEEAVNAWEDTLGHRALLAGGEYVWGCIYAQNTFGVAIVAY